MKITFKGQPVILVGRKLKIDNPAPFFKVVLQDLKEIGLENFPKKIKLITSFPSIDTSVCDLQIKEFNKRATNFSSEVIVLGISKDLPFAQKRFCESFGIKNVILASDYKFSSFGINYGLLIKELNLLARAILILDKNDIVRYIQIVQELSIQPDYEDALKNLEQVLNNPGIIIKEEFPSKCQPCEIGSPPLPKEEVEKLLLKYPDWQLVDDKKIVKEFKFKNFVEAKYFLDFVSIIAEEQGHHPTMTLVYNKLKITLTTHASGGLTKNDFIIVNIIEENI